MITFKFYASRNGRKRIVKDRAIDMSIGDIELFITERSSTEKEKLIVDGVVYAIYTYLFDKDMCEFFRNHNNLYVYIDDGFLFVDEDTYDYMFLSPNTIEIGNSNYESEVE